MLTLPKTLKKPEEQGTLPDWLCKAIQIRWQDNPDNKIWQRYCSQENYRPKFLINIDTEFSNYIKISPTIHKEELELIPEMQLI